MIKESQYLARIDQLEGELLAAQYAAEAASDTIMHLKGLLAKCEGDLEAERKRILPRLW